MKNILELEEVSRAIEGQTNRFDTITDACKRALFIAAGFSLVVNLLQLTLPLYMMQMLDRVVGGGSVNTLYLLAAIAAVALIVGALLDIIRAHILNRAASWLESRMGVEIFPHVALAQHTGKLAQAQGLEDLWRVRSFMSSPGIIAIFDVPWMLFYLVILFWLAVPIGFIALIGAAVLIGIALYNESAVSSVLKNAYGVAETSRDFVRSVQRSSDEIVSMGMMRDVQGLWFTHNIKALQSQYSSSERAATHLASFRFFRLLLQMAVLSVGAILVLDNQMTPGGIIGASIIMSRALAPVEQSITAWKQLISALGSYTRLKSILPETEQREMTAPYPSGKSALTLDDVGFTFPGASTPFLSNISFTAKPGDITVLIGPSSAGKSTLAKVIAGSHLPSSGFVLLNDFEMTHYSRSVIGPYIGYLPQKHDFIPGTILENVSRFRELPLEDVIEAANRVGAHDFIMELPDGYDSRLGGDLGIPLSGGQLQRLAIARAICGGPGLLVLDEPNLNLDTEAQEQLNKLLHEEKAKGTTIIIVSHQDEMIRLADRIAVINKGSLEFFGTRNQVVNRLSKPRPEVRRKMVSPESLSAKKPLNRIPDDSETLQPAPRGKGPVDEG